MDFAPCPGVVGSASPFVTKVEAWLRFVGLDYEKRHGSLQDFGKAPNGKVRLGEIRTSAPWAHSLSALPVASQALVSVAAAFQLSPRASGSINSS